MRFDFVADDHHVDRSYRPAQQFCHQETQLSSDPFPSRRSMLMIVALLSVTCSATFLRDRGCFVVRSVCEMQSVFFNAKVCV